jgi:predicted RNase H-like HicB family nuclease
MEIEIYKSNDNMYVATCPELELFSKGRTQKEAIKRLEDSISRHLLAQEKRAQVQDDIKDTAGFYSLHHPQIH